MPTNAIVTDFARGAGGKDPPPPRKVILISSINVNYSVFANGSSATPTRITKQRLVARETLSLHREATLNGRDCCFHPLQLTHISVERIISIAQRHCQQREQSFSLNRRNKQSHCSGAFNTKKVCCCDQLAASFWGFLDVMATPLFVSLMLCFCHDILFCLF